MHKSPYSTVKMLWIGTELSMIEQLSVLSFLRCGHEVQLFTYGKVKNVPDGVTLRDANCIITEDKIFKHHEKNSYAPFSDWFRYQLLYLEGGIWSDMDMICLKKLDFNQPLFFCQQQFGLINNAILGTEKREHMLFHILMKQAESPNDFLPYDNFKTKKRKLTRKYLKGNQRNNLTWAETGPYALTDAINYHNLHESILPHTHFYPIHPGNWDTVFDDTFSEIDKYFKNSYAIHIWNAMPTSLNITINKDGPFQKNSLIEQLRKSHMG